MDATVARMHALAEQVCTQCSGQYEPNPHSGKYEPESHKPVGYRVTGMQGYARYTADSAIAWFGLTRGNVIVRIDGESSWMWWFPTLDEGEDRYVEARRALAHVTSQPPTHGV